MSAWNQPLLINILGHVAGALLYSIFLVLLYSGRGWSEAEGRHLPGLAAVLSLIWNLGSLIVLAWPTMPPLILALVVAVSFSVLSLLPAVLLHLSVKSSWPPLIVGGYLLSAVAVVMHFREIQGNGPQLHQSALLLITVGFLALTAAAVIRAALRQDTDRPNGTRMVASMCLALFATSFVHFGPGHASEAWSSELIVHHAGIPLALLVLLQDYRFVLLDAFVRFLANALLAAVLGALVIAAAFRLVPADRITPQPLPEASLLIGVCLFLVFFAWLRSRVQAWLTHAIFQQGDLSDLAARIKDSQSFANEEQFLESASALIAAAARTKDFAIVGEKELAAASDLHLPVATSLLPESAIQRWSWAEVILPIRVAPGASSFILLGRRKGGQRYLGEDLDALARAVVEVAGQLELLRQREMNRLVSQAELRALQSQINPHFLFNALNTVYGTIPREARVARRMVLNLAEIFRYFLQSNKTFVPLSEEIQIVRAYLEVEQARLGDRLKVEIKMDDAVLGLPIPVLSVQPLVENAIKHGVAQSHEPGYVRITGDFSSGDLRISVENSASPDATNNPGPGVGFQNVRRRLEICYGQGAYLRMAAYPEKTIVELCIPAREAVQT